MRKSIEAVEGEAGRPAIAPRLWWQSGNMPPWKGYRVRTLARLCEAHPAYKKLLGGVSVNYHKLSDFQVSQEARLVQLLTHIVAVLMQERGVDQERTAQGGVCICASAGANSFRRQTTLVECLQKAEERAAAIKDANPSGEGETSE
jgi:hypothetical protein